MRPALSSILALPVALLAACGSEPAEAPADETPEPVVPTENVVRPTDFASLRLGGMVQTPLGPETEGSLIDGDTAIGDIASRVQCPDGVDTCDPEAGEEGRIYTYIYEVRPGFDGPNDEGFPMPEQVEPVENAESFALAFPAYGFTGVAGYSIGEAQDLLAEGYNAVISCEDGRIAWTFPVEAGWSTGETITFFWQSTQPPAEEPTGEYRFSADARTAIGRGPVPVEGGEMPAVCD